MSNPNSIFEHTVSDAAGSIERKVWAFPPTDEQARTAILFLDAEIYLLAVGAPEVVNGLQRTGKLPAVVSVLISHNDAASRQSDFICQTDYAAFIAQDVTGWIRARYPGIRDIILVGLSLSGLAAAFAFTQFQSSFSAAICQSPSFWWEDGRFCKELPPASPAGKKLWVCVGDNETDANVSHAPSGLFQKLTQIQGCEQACTALRERGFDVTYRMYAGGHDPACWRADLELALPWAIGVGGE
jgi:enterochelin esterase family protein